MPVRSVVCGLLCVLTIAACTSDPPRDDVCRVRVADVATVPGWVGYLAEHPDDVAVVFDDGRGTRVEHRADDVQPFASAIKIVHLVAYTRAVAIGRVRPDEPVRIGDWERWSAVGTEQSRAMALDTLGIPRNGMRARDPARTVTIDQVASAMTTFSDNAAPDWLRARLGDRALVDAAREVGAVVTRATELRRADGSVAIGVLLARRVSPADTDRVLATPGLDDITAAAAGDPDLVPRLSCGGFR